MSFVLTILLLLSMIGNVLLISQKSALKEELANARKELVDTVKKEDDQKNKDDQNSE